MLALRIPVFNPKSTKHFEKLCHKIVEQRKNSKEERKDILHNFIKAAEESPDLMTPKMMFKTMVQFFSDGYETFSGIGKIMIFLITAHPQVQEQLWEEIDSVVGDHEDITEEDLANLPYLDQVGHFQFVKYHLMFTGCE